MLVSPFDLERAEILARINLIQKDLIETNNLITDFKTRWVAPALERNSTHPAHVFLLTKILDQATRFSMRFWELKAAYIEEVEKTKEVERREIVHNELKKFQI